jgi:hypothetical protein
MVNDSSHNPISRFQAEAELELVKLLLNSEQPYPWDPSDIEAESYFAELEQAVASEWSVEELASQHQAFFAQLDTLWSAEISSVDTVQALQETLAVQFGSRVPHQLLRSIAEKAQHVFTTNLSLADQLVHCVNGLLPSWSDDDLQVLARPLAFSMRGADPEQLEVALRSVRYAAWTELSGIDQARLSLAIARYAIAQLPAQGSAGR